MPATISPIEGDIGIKDNPNLLTYSIISDDGMSAITEKVNGVTVGVRNVPTSGQQFTVDLTEAQWDEVTYGKFGTETLQEIPKFDNNQWDIDSAAVVTPDSVTLSPTGTSQYASIVVPVEKNSLYEFSIVADGRSIVHLMSNETTVEKGSIALLNDIGNATFSTSENTKFIMIVLGTSAPGTYTYSVPVVTKKINYNTLTIEMGNNVWTYTFDKRLAADDDLITAVKAVKDTDEVFLPAIKSLLGFAIADKGGTVPGNPKWWDIEEAIRNIPDGKRWATGTLSTPSALSPFEYLGDTSKMNMASITVTGLDFEPSIILAVKPSQTTGSTSNITVYFKDLVKPFPMLTDGQIYYFTVANRYYDGRTYSFKVASPAVVNETMFVLPGAGNSNYEWLAIE